MCKREREEKRASETAIERAKERKRESEREKEIERERVGRCRVLVVLIAQDFLADGCVGWVCVRKERKRERECVCEIERKTRKVGVTCWLC